MFIPLSRLHSIAFADSIGIGIGVGFFFGASFGLDT